MWSVQTDRIIHYTSGQLNVQHELRYAMIIQAFSRDLMITSILPDTIQNKLINSTGYK